MGESEIRDLVDRFVAAEPARTGDCFKQITDAVWDDGRLTPQALPTVTLLVDSWDRVGTLQRAYLALLIGLLAEGEYPHSDGPVTQAARRGLDRYLEQWRQSPGNWPVSHAVLYLLSHFPADRERILAVAAEKELDPQDVSRLERALQPLDRDAPELGRVFPSPWVWRLMNTEEREFDQGWIKSLTAAQVEQNWHSDTRTVLGHSGAKAYWAVRNGPPLAVTAGPLPSRDVLRQPAAEPDIEVFSRHADAWRCPDCGSELTSFAVGGARCHRCSVSYPIVRGILNLTAGERGAGTDFLYKLAEVPTMGLFYETYARPAFLRVSGSNWGGAVTETDEDSYIAEHVVPVEGPVLDLGAGAGRWTSALVRAVGADRVIALDLYPQMLTTLRTRIPDVPAVLASASKLPFGDATLGAVMCWNALQAFPDDAPAAIAEVGRCLRPGGTFSFLTFRMDDDPVYRYFQRSHHLPGHPHGLRLFELDELREWLDKAGLVVRHEHRPGTFVIMTAERAR